MIPFEYTVESQNELLESICDYYKKLLKAKYIPESLDILNMLRGQINKLSVIVYHLNNFEYIEEKIKNSNLDKKMQSLIIDNILVNTRYSKIQNNFLYNKKIKKEKLNDN